MARENTNNPLPSNDLRDLNDNTLIMDDIVNSEDLTTTNRFQKSILTYSGIEKKVQDTVDEIVGGAGFLPSRGGTISGDLTITGNNEIQGRLIVSNTSGIDYRGKDTNQGEYTTELDTGTNEGLNYQYTANGTTTTLLRLSGGNLQITALLPLLLQDGGNAVSDKNLSLNGNKTEWTAQLSSGLIIKGGTVDINAYYQQIRFQNAFPNNILSAFVIDNGGTGAFGVNIAESTKDGFFVRSPVNKAGIAYIAFGQ